MASKLLVLILSFSLLSVISSQNFGDLIKKEPNQIDFLRDKGFDSQDGFLAGTKIKVPTGYKHIEDIDIGEFVTGNDSVKQVICIAKRNVSKYLSVMFQNEIIRTALNQKFYLLAQNSWIKAKDLNVRDVCLSKSSSNGRIDSIETVDNHVACYALTVDDHVFFVSEKDICVHNMNVIVDPSAMVVIGSMILYNPIILTVGATIALSVIAVNVREMIENRTTDIDLHTLKNSSQLDEGQYFDLRRTELIFLKHKFVNILHGLEKIAAVYRNHNPWNFSYLFFNNNKILADCSSCNQPFLGKKDALTDDQRAYLRMMREYELTHLEQEIINLQITLAFHFNELIQIRDNAIKEFTDISPKIKEAVRDWNNNVANLSDQMMLYQYQEIHLTLEEILKNIENRNYELRLALGYYKDEANALILRNTTNIDSIICKQEPIIKSTETLICQERKANVEWQKINEEALLRRNYNVNRLRNETNTRLHKNRELKIAKELADAQVNKGNITPPVDPEDPEDDDEDNFFIKLKKRSDRKVRSKRFGNLYRDPATGLWWSKDTAGHGGLFSKKQRLVSTGNTMRIFMD